MAIRRAPRARRVEATGSFFGTLANIESGDQNVVSQTDKDSKGLTLAQGGNPGRNQSGALPDPDSDVLKDFCAASRQGRQ